MRDTGGGPKKTEVICAPFALCVVEVQVYSTGLQPAVGLVALERMTTTNASLVDRLPEDQKE